MEHVSDDDLVLIALGEDSQFRDHVTSCPRCSARMDDMRGTVALARRAREDGPLLTPPAHVWEEIQAELTPRPARKPVRWYALAASVGVIVGGIAGALIVTNQGSDTIVPVASAELAPLEGFSSTGVAEVVQTTQGPALSVSVDALEPIDGYYEVWLLKPDASGMVSVGILDSADQGLYPLPAGIPLEEFPVVDVSIEEFDGNAAHSAVSVVRGSLDA